MCERWVRAWGKLPSGSPAWGSNSSAKSPRSLAVAAARSKKVRASATRSWWARHSTSQNVAGEGALVVPALVAPDEAVDHQPLQHGVDGGHHQRVAPVHEVDRREEEQGRVERGLPEDVDEAAAVGVHPLLEHHGPAGVGLGPPARDPVGAVAVQGLGQPHAPVEGHPHEHLRVHELPGVAPDLPDAVVGVAQRSAARSTSGHQEAPPVVVGLVAPPVPEPGQLEQLPVGVELELRGGAVADAHRGAAAPALQVVEGPLEQVVLAADAEGDVELVGAPGGAALDEAAEAVGAVDVAELGERADGHQESRIQVKR